MQELKKIFFNKKILIYGLGISGKSSFKYLKKNNQVNIYDDDIKKCKLKIYKNFFIGKNKIIKEKFDFVIISPGINRKKCGLTKYLKNNNERICTDLDIFYANNNKNKIITVTGTNGKSTTVKLISEILNNAKIDARCVGNIGKSVLNENKIKKNTIFVIEASSYQIEYSKFFKSKYSLLLNINHDHLERHGNFKNYLKAKIKLFVNKSRNDFAFFDNSNPIISNSIKKNKIKCRIICVKKKINKNYLSKIDNSYFLNKNNLQNLSFVFSICKKLKIKDEIILKTINEFTGLKYRQQIVYNSNNLIIINDSKSTSFSSTVNLIDSYQNVFWILGGRPKKNDKFNFKKNNLFNIKAYIFGKNKNFFIKQIKNKIKYKIFPTIKDALRKALADIKSSNISSKKTILFSPCSASFDKFKNFEERGAYFNFLLKQEKIKL